ncbi:MAG TPA: ParA family protein [Thiothrix sp.]|nr:ParA family protein [Thiothrix sp.]
MITVVGNLKGGTGKSTVAFNLSLWVATHRNVYVAVYDLDPQATLSDALEIRTEDGYTPKIIPKNTVDSLGSEGENAEVIVDIGMSDMDAMKQAIAQADRIVVPVGPSQADVWSTQRFLKLVQDVKKGDEVKILGFMNRADTHKAVRETDEAYDALKTLPLITMLTPRLYQRTVYRRSFSEGLAVFELDPRSKATTEVDALGNVLY